MSQGLGEHSPGGIDTWMTVDHVWWVTDSVDSSAPLTATGGRLARFNPDGGFLMIAAAFGRNPGSDSVWAWLTEPTYYEGAWRALDSSRCEVCYRLTYRFMPVRTEVSPGVWEEEKIPGDPLIDTLLYSDSSSVGPRLRFDKRILGPADLLMNQTRKRIEEVRIDSAIVREAREMLDGAGR